MNDHNMVLGMVPPPCLEGICKENMADSLLTTIMSMQIVLDIITSIYDLSEQHKYARCGHSV